jgi:hypothetical protein
MAWKWAYGITTVPSRRDTYLPRTLESLRAAGFDEPRLFVDGLRHPRPYDQLSNLDITIRYPAVGPANNWILSMWELYLRNPQADRYVIFQDDIVTYPNLRHFLDRCVYPINRRHEGIEDGYLNLYTSHDNQPFIPPQPGTAIPQQGWFKSNQRGRGALALVFHRSILVRLLGDLNFASRPQDLPAAYKSIDGGIVRCLGNLGIREYVHSPTLVQHIGKVSTIGNMPPPREADFFMGEGFSALELLE